MIADIWNHVVRWPVVLLIICVALMNDATAQQSGRRSLNSRLSVIEVEHVQQQLWNEGAHAAMTRLDEGVHGLKNQLDEACQLLKQSDLERQVEMLSRQVSQLQGQNAQLSTYQAYQQQQIRLLESRLRKQEPTTTLIGLRNSQLASRPSRVTGIDAPDHLWVSQTGDALEITFSEHEVVLKPIEKTVPRSAICRLPESSKETWSDYVSTFPLPLTRALVPRRVELKRLDSSCVELTMTYQDNRLHVPIQDRSKTVLLTRSNASK